MYLSGLIVGFVIVFRQWWRRRLLCARIGTLHPGRRTDGTLRLRLVLLRIVLRLLILLRLILRRRVTLRRLRLGFHIGAAHCERIGLADQARQFRQRIALGLLAMLICAAAIVIMGGKRSVLISISHRLRCIPSRKEPNRTSNEWSPARCRGHPHVRGRLPLATKLPHLGRCVDAEYGQS